MGGGGSNDPVALSTSVLSDKKLEPFHAQDFDATEFTSRALSGVHASAQSTTEELRDGIRRLEVEIRQEVMRKQDALMLVIRKLSQTERETRGIETSVNGLQATVGQLKSALLDPCAQIRATTRQLRNVRDTVEFLRHVNHRLKLTQRLRTQMETGQSGGMGSGVDMAQAAKLLTEIQAIGKEVDVSGVHFLENDSEFLDATLASIEQQAKATLKKGIESLNQADVGNALQVYFNLEALPVAIDAWLSESVQELEQEAKTAFDLRQVAGGSAAHSGTTWQERLWSRIRDVMGLMEKSCVGVWHLHQVLAKKRDPVSHICFLDVVQSEGDKHLLSVYWERMTQGVAGVIGNIVHPSRAAAVRDALTAGYPKLSGMLEELFEKVVNRCGGKALGSVTVNASHLEALMASFEPIQNAYLSRSLSRMTEAASAAFPGGTRTLPSPADVTKCIGKMHEELKAVGGSLHVASLVAGNVGRAVMMLAERVEYMASTGPEVRSVGGACTSAQFRNIALSSHLQEIHRSLVSVVPKLAAPAAEALVSPMGVLRGAAIETVAPIFKAWVETFEQAVLEIHSGVNEWDKDTSPKAGASQSLAASAYMKALVEKLAGFRNEYLLKFTPPPTPTVSSFVSALVQRMACRIVVYFLRHAALLRPLGSQGKLQLSRDMLELQKGITQCLFPIERIGQPYKHLRAFNALIFIDTSTVQTSPIAKDLPRALVLHHLYSRAPSGLLSPHARSGLSPSRYSLWLDQHSEEDAVKGVKSALAACESKAKMQPGFDDIFPLMMELCNV